MNITPIDVRIAREKHPEAKVLVHPECRASVTEQADYAGSTTGIMNYAKAIARNSSSARRAASCSTSSSNVRIEILPSLRPLRMSQHEDYYPILMYTTLLGEGGEEIQLSDELIRDAKRPIDRMIELGK